VVTVQQAGDKAVSIMRPGAGAVQMQCAGVKAVRVRYLWIRTIKVKHSTVDGKDTAFRSKVYQDKAVKLKC
jgi:hypothetical protein